MVSMTSNAYLVSCITQNFNRYRAMFNRFPDQAASRKGFTLVGVIFFAFGVATAWLAAPVLAFLGFVGSVILLLPALSLGHAAFAKAEKYLSTIFAGW